jgi:hypothetical protein
MAAPRKKPPVKKPPVKKAPVKKKPSFLRKDTPRPARDVKPGDLRQQASQGPKQTGTSSPAKDLNKGGLRAQYLEGPKKPDVKASADPKRPIFRLEKGGRLLMRKDAGSVLLKRAVTKIPVIGAAAGFIADAAPAGEGSTKDKYSTLKKKYSSAIGPDKFKRKGGEGLATYSDIPRERTVKYNPGDYAKYRSGQGNPSAASGFGKRISEGAKFERLRASRAALAKQPKPKAGSSDAFTLGSGAQSRPPSGAALNPKPNPPRPPNQVAKSATVKKVGRLTRAEREGLSTDRMQRKPKGNLLGFLKKRK